MPDILSQICEVLELENELGTRSVEIDRALLSAPQIKVISNEAEGKVTEKAKSLSANLKVNYVSQSSFDSTQLSKKPIVLHHDLLFIESDLSKFEGEAGELFDKMLSAMKLTREDVTLSQTGKVCDLHLLVRDVKPKCIVVFGREARDAIIDQCKCAKGIWTSFEGVALALTVSPAHIVRISKVSPPSVVTTLKREVWTILQSAMRRIAI